MQLCRSCCSLGAVAGWASCCQGLRSRVVFAGLCGVLLHRIRASGVCDRELRLQVTCSSSDLGDSTSVNRAWYILLLALLCASV